MYCHSVLFSIINSVAYYDQLVSTVSSWSLLYGKYGHYGQLVSMICQCSSVFSVFGRYVHVSQCMVSMIISSVCLVSFSQYDQ